MSSGYFRKIMGFKSYCCFEVIYHHPMQREKMCGKECVLYFPELPHLPNTSDALNIPWETELLLLSGLKYSDFACSLELTMRIYIGFNAIWQGLSRAPSALFSGHKGDFFVQCWQQVGMMGQVAIRGLTRISFRLWICSSTLEFSCSSWSLNQ